MDEKEGNRLLNFYLENGFTLLPVEANSKKPKTKWQDLQSRKNTSQEIKDIIVNLDKQNLGVVCGKTSDNLVVFDLETEEYYKGVFPNHEDINDKTLVNKTSKGYHVFAICEGFEPPRPMHFAPVGDILGEGSFAMLPPSVHTSGTHYQNIALLPPIKISKMEFEAIANRMKLYAEEKNGKKRADAQAAISGVQQGNRNNSAFRLAVNFKRLRTNKEETLLLLQKWNENNSPPLEEKELNTVIESAFRRVYAQNELQSAFELKDKGVARKIIAEQIMNEEIIITIMGTGQMFYYTDGIYSDADEYLRMKIGGVLEGNIVKEKHGTHLVSEIIEFIRTYTYVDPKSFADNGNLVCVINGVLNLETGELSDHSPNYFFFNRIPVNYGSGADCPKIKKFLNEVLGNQEDIDSTFEMAGYLLYRGHSVHKAFMLFGGGNNG